MKVTRRSRAAAAFSVAAGAMTMTLVNAAPAEASCQYTVTWQSAGVYEHYDMAWHLKTKYLGQSVGGYCDKVWNGTYWMTAVQCDCDWVDGKAWMRSAALNPA